MCLWRHGPLFSLRALVQTPPKTKSGQNTERLSVLMVPGGGFEPPTRGFSIRCSTPELPGQSLQTIVVKAPSGAAPPESARVIACDFALASANFPFARQAAVRCGPAASRRRFRAFPVPR